MKQKILTATFILCISMICFGDAFRTFRDANGRTLEACLKIYDPQSDIVTVELKNKSIKKVKASVFSEQDQAYIHDWYMADAMLTGTLVDLSAKKITIDSGTDPDGQGEWKSYNSDMRYRDRNYKILLKNKSGLTLNGVKIEYCIYHQCTIDEARSSQKETNVHFPSRIESNIVSGIWNIPVLNNKQKLEHITKSIHLRRGEVQKRIAVNFTSYTRELKDELLGLRVRLYTTLQSGEEIMKEYSFPSYLIEKSNWEFSTNNISSEVPILPRPEHELIRQNFDKIKEGMSKEEVGQLVGYPPSHDMNDDIWIWYFKGDDIWIGNLNVKENAEVRRYNIRFKKDVVVKIEAREI